jgi:hypothetical protein
MSVATPSVASGTNTLIHRFLGVRRFSESLCEGLATEDFVVQSMEDVSPTKWHLAHTSWFFETFILREFHAGYRPLDEGYAYLFNSYYVQAGERHCRAQRGYISRPTVAEVFEYRRYVDEAMVELLDRADAETLARLHPLVEIGLNHEQQHQELMLTDLKHVFSVNPLRPVYRERVDAASSPVARLEWLAFPRVSGRSGTPATASHTTTRARATGASWRRSRSPRGPSPTGSTCSSWKMAATGARSFGFPPDGPPRRRTAGPNPSTGSAATASGGSSLCRGCVAWIHDEPVCHLSYFEADAYARWAGARLPREEEWEVAAEGVEIEGNLADAGTFHPTPARGGDGLLQMFGDVWEWTQSQYTGYPGYRPPEGALGEYNGKFMCNQFVLRGGSCATPASHIRPTYRNFFPPDATWQFTGVRLAR